MIRIIILALFLGAAPLAFASQFEELDKDPEGAHRGQIFLGAFASIGGIFGELIDAENQFINYSTYTFTSNSITKMIKVNTMPMGYGLLFEYMPIDHLGLKTKIRRSTTIQRTMFGSQFQNWSRITYSDFSWYAGLSAHVSNRKQWDITFTPLLGYALATYRAAPIASLLIPEGYLYQALLGRTTMSVDQALGFSGARKKTVNYLTVGGEANVCAYFSGGFFLTIGFEWIMNIIQLKKAFFLQNPQNYRYFYPGRRESYLHSYMISLSAGYAFYN